MAHRPETIALVIHVSPRERALLDAMLDVRGLRGIAARRWMTDRLSTHVDIAAEVPAARDLLRRFEAEGQAVKMTAGREQMSGFVRSIYGRKTWVGRRCGDGSERTSLVALRVPVETLAQVDRDARGLGLTRASLARDRILGTPLARVRHEWSVDTHVRFLRNLIALGDAVLPVPAA